MKLKPVQIRDMDSDIWNRVKLAALKRGITIARWLMEAIRYKLRRENG